MPRDPGMDRFLHAFCSSSDLVAHFESIALEAGAAETATREIEQAVNFCGRRRFVPERAGALKISQVLAWPGWPEEFAAQLRRDRERYGLIVREARIRAD